MTFCIGPEVVARGSVTSGTNIAGTAQNMDSVVLLDLTLAQFWYTIDGTGGATQQLFVDLLGVTLERVWPPCVRLSVLMEMMIMADSWRV